ncbi:class I SAM-dependent methyltransferase [Hellea sp.]|nr:class I SAM-dependent methyltransferase [Hellea sp.]
MTKTLTSSQARDYYDGYGAKQDTQGWYEDKAMDELCAHAAFDEAEAVMEFGCGTGKLAERLLARELPEAATYLGLDISSEMISLSKARLEPFKDRARLRLTQGEVTFDFPDASYDRFVSTYVFDLLSEQDTTQILSEAHRILKPGGRLCLASLTQGCSPWSKFVSKAWALVHQMNPSKVGGCRPILFSEHLDTAMWSVQHRKTLTAYGLPSEVLIAIKP